jgi:hypothetical protein
MPIYAWRYREWDEKLMLNSINISLPGEVECFCLELNSLKLGEVRSFDTQILLSRMPRHLDDKKVYITESRDNYISIEIRIVSASEYPVICILEPFSASIYLEDSARELLILAAQKSKTFGYVYDNYVDARILKDSGEVEQSQIIFWAYELSDVIYY